MNQYIGFMPNPEPVGKKLKAEMRVAPMLLLSKDQVVNKVPVVKEIPENEALEALFERITARLQK